MLSLYRLSVLAFMSMCMCACTGGIGGSSSQNYPQRSSTGGPPWAQSSNKPGNDDVAALPPPDIAIPLEGMAGVWTGGRLARQLDAEARDIMQDVTQNALTNGASGSKVTWRNGALRGTVTPQMAFVGPAQLTCREFHQTVRAGDIVETGYATACQAPDGSWRLLSE